MGHSRDPQMPEPIIDVMDINFHLARLRHLNSAVCKHLYPLHLTRHGWSVLEPPSINYMPLQAAVLAEYIRVRVYSDGQNRRARDMEVLLVRDQGGTTSRVKF